MNGRSGRSDLLENGVKSSEPLPHSPAQTPAYYCLSACPASTRFLRRNIIVYLDHAKYVCDRGGCLPVPLFFSVVPPDFSLRLSFSLASAEELTKLAVAS